MNKINIGATCDEFGINERFYDYVQLLTNNNYFSYQKIKNIIETSNNDLKIFKDFSVEQYDNDQSQISTDKYVFHIIKRVKFIPILLSQLDFLLKNKKLIPEIISYIYLYF